MIKSKQIYEVGKLYQIKKMNSPFSKTYKKSYKQEYVELSFIKEYWNVPNKNNILKPIPYFNSKVIFHGKQEAYVILLNKTPIYGVVGIGNRYYKVLYKNMIGYIHFWYLE